jgi:hypothetical protein
MTDLVYALGPWVANPDTVMGGWVPPLGARCNVDLGSLPDCGQATGDSRPRAFFGFDPETPPGLDYLTLGRGDCRELRPAESVRQSAESLLGVSLVGETVVDWLWSAILDGDPTGANRWKPLVPTHLSDLQLHLAGHSLVRSERFRWGQHAHTNRLRDLLRADFAQTVGELRSEYGRLRAEAAKEKDPRRKAQLEAAAEALKDDKQAGKILTATANKYRIDPREISTEVEPRKPSTTLTESFDGTDLSALGPSYTWACDATYGMVIYGNAAVKYSNSSSSAAERTARCNTTLSGADHSVSSINCVIRAGGGATIQSGAAARLKADRTDYYMMFGSEASGAYQVLLGKYVASVYTGIGTGDTTAWSGKTFVTEPNGSTITGKLDTTTKYSPTDTSISSGTGVGIYMLREGAGVYSDIGNWSAADLATWVKARILGGGFL